VIGQLNPLVSEISVSNRETAFLSIALKYYLIKPRST
jgi:hypothetical protein